MATHSIVQEITIPIEYHGQRIDVVLAALFPDFSRSTLSQWLKSGTITVNHAIRKPKDKVIGGELVHLQVDPVSDAENLSAEDIPLNIIFEDEHLLIINKSAGLIVHPGAGNPRHTLVNGLLHHEPDLQRLPRAGIVHRLDKDTTGLLIVAKTIPSYTHLVRLMQAREIQRHYTTLVLGHVIAGGEVNTYYGRHPRNRLKMAVCTQGKEAITLYRVLKHYHYFTLLDVKLMTGRTHQIRVHMDHINHPVIGDQLYGRQKNLSLHVPEIIRETLSLFKRQALHAYSLNFAHPILHHALTFTAPLPDDFQTIITLMDEYIV